MLNEIALRRLRLLAVPSDRDNPADPKDQSDRDNGSDQDHHAEGKIIGLAELAQLGYRVTNPDLWSDSVLLHWEVSVIPTLTALRGGDVQYAPLFAGFPEVIPRHNNVGIDEALHVVRRAVPDPVYRLMLESLGEKATRSLRVSSIPQNPKQTRRELKRQGGKRVDQHTEWVDLTLAPAADVETSMLEWMRDLLYSPTSMKDAEVADVTALLVHFGLEVVDMDQVTFLETRAILLQLMWQANAFDELQLAQPRPTEILRLFARLTGTDVSLMKAVRFPRLSKKQRRTVLACIDQCVDPAEDLFRYRNLWLRVAEFLHPGQYAKRYPVAYRAISQLREHRRNSQSYEARVERLVEETKSPQSELLVLLAQRPTVFARRLRKLLVDAGPVHADAVLDAFAEVASAVPPKALLTLRTHIDTVEALPRRAVINRRGSVRIIDSPPLLDTDVKASVLGILDQAIDAALGAGESWSGRKAWIDGELTNYVAPLQQRTLSDGMLNVARGTRLPLDLQKVLRLFVYWKQPPGQQSDLDLSAVTFDSDLRYLGHVDWTRLSTQGVVHSGDITSAPVGAAEFIDITLNSLGSNVRYVAPQIYRFRGPAFPDLVRSHAGWMVRSKPGSDGSSKAFDISTVQNVFDLTGRNAFAVPFVADVFSGEVIFTDLYVGRRQMHNQVAAHESTVAEICEAVRHFTDNRLTLHELARRNVLARGATIVDNRSEANLTFGVDTDCQFSAKDVAAINANLLG